MLMEGEKISDIKSMCLVDYANFLHRKKKIEKAIKLYMKAIHFKTNNFYAYSGLAAALVTKKSFNQALDYCNKALAIKPNGRPFILLSIIYKSLGQSDLAEDAFQKSLKYYENNSVAAYDRLAYTYWSYNMFDKAEYYCKKAISLNPDDPSIHYHLAAVYSAKKQYQMAIYEYQKVLELTSDRKYIKYAKKEINILQKSKNN